MRVRNIIGASLIVVSGAFILLYFLSNEEYRELSAMHLRDHPLMVLAAVALALGAVILDQRCRREYPSD